MVGIGVGAGPGLGLGLGQGQGLDQIVASAVAAMARMIGAGMLISTLLVVGIVGWSKYQEWKEWRG